MTEMLKEFKEQKKELGSLNDDSADNQYKSMYVIRSDLECLNKHALQITDTLSYQNILLNELTDNIDTHDRCN